MDWQNATESQRIRYNQKLAEDSDYQPFRRTHAEPYLPFQRAGIEYAVERSTVLLADPPGLGKTYQAIGVANALMHERVLVVCPASLKYMWEHYLKRWYCGEMRIHVVEGTTETIPVSANLVVVNYDVIHKPYIARQLSLLRFDQIIYDECQALINPLSARGRMVREVFSSMVTHPTSVGKHVLISATPLTSKPIHLWNILATFTPETIDPYLSYYDYAAQFCEGRNIYRDEWYVNGASNLQELNFRLRATIMARRDKASVLRTLPPKKPAQMLPLESADISEIRQAESEAISIGALSAAGLKEYGVPQQDRTAPYNKEKIMAALAKLRASISRQKIPLAVSVLKEYLSTRSEKIVVFVVHKEVARALEQELAEYQPIVIVGDTLTRKRFALAEQFQTDPSKRLVIGNIQAAGVGLTLTAATTVFFVEIPWTPAEWEQAEDRVHRIGQTEQVTTYAMVMRGTLEEYILRGLLNKQAVLNSILDVDIYA